MELQRRGEERRREAERRGMHTESLSVEVCFFVPPNLRFRPRLRK